MQAEQRAPASKESLEPSATLWQPTIILKPDDREEALSPSGSETYVVVEEFVDGLVTLEVSTWPHLDKDGRLHFEGDPWSLTEPLKDLQPLVNNARADNAQVGADRDLRIGDVFMATNLPTDATSLADAREIVDVSAGARSAAKAALYGAVASTVTEEYAEEMAVVGPNEPPREPGYFDVRQQKMEPRDYGSEMQS